MFIELLSFRAGQINIEQERFRHFLAKTAKRNIREVWMPASLTERHHTAILSFFLKIAQNARSFCPKNGNGFLFAHTEKGHATAKTTQTGEDTHTNYEFQ